MAENPIVLDIGGRGSCRSIGLIADGVQHPVWSQARFLSVNIDASCRPDIFDDAVKLRRIRDACVDGIYSSHTIEHIPPYQSGEMFRNWYRVLRQGSRVEIRCPDIEWAWREFLTGELPGTILDELITGVCSGPHQLHQNVFWADKLLAVLREAGFENCARISYEQTAPLLDFWLYDGQHLESRGRPIPDLVIVAQKPHAGSAVAGAQVPRVPLGYEAAVASVLTPQARQIWRLRRCARRWIRPRALLRGIWRMARCGDANKLPRSQVAG